MNRIDCLIVEDEPLAADLLKEYITQLPYLNLVGNATSATEALTMLNSNQIELLFLDLHLPGLKGFELLKTLSFPPKVIVTTAYHQYALESYDFAVVDYLLKPIAFERFLKAVNKATLSSTSSSKGNPAETDLKVIQLKEGRSIIPVLESDIEFVESQRDYVIIHTSKAKIKTKSTLHAFLERLSSGHFIRIHKSYIIRKSLVSSYTSRSIQISGTSLPIGRNYIDNVRSILDMS